MSNGSKGYINKAKYQYLQRANSSKSFFKFDQFAMAANMEVKVISRETIKPSSATPHHLRTHKLSLLDQLEVAESVYLPVILFYSVISPLASGKISEILKDSLSKTLAHYYPFAGRLKDSFSVDCNDEGVVYVEAHVATDMSIVLKDPESDLLLQLQPSESLERLPDPTAQVLVAIQVNFFACGGMAICACVDHAVADASAVATCIKTWAEIASGSNSIINVSDVIYSGTSLLFPAQDLSGFVKQLSIYKENDDELQSQGKIVTKRFLFDGPKIAALKKEIGNGTSSPYRPSRFEAVSALIWSAILSTSSTKNDKLTYPNVITFAVNLRNRLSPPFPQQCIGNVLQVVEASVPDQTETSSPTHINLSSLAGKLHEAIRKIDDEYVKKLGAGGYLNIIESYMRNKVFNFTSWCRFPFYEADFGWGKPIWFVTTL
ncbi:hypothetical protein PTKIN_Ptkin05aG0197500 [Pterospermum kingtungense]